MEPRGVGIDSLFADAWPLRQRRASAFGQQGMVASASSAAALEGAQILRTGGNAFDAVLGMALVEGVALPWACGLGGDAYCLLYHAESGQFRAICGSGAAPSRATATLFRERGYRFLPGDGPLATGVPGALDAYLLLHETYGTRRWAALVQPAVELAEGGVVVSPRLAHYLRVGQTRLERYPSSAGEYLAQGLPAVGSVLRRSALAGMLHEVAQTGRSSFYQGRLAEVIARACAAAGGLLDAADLAAHDAELEAPLKTSYRDLELFQPPLPSQGFVMLEMLNLLERFDLDGLDPLGEELIHLVAEAKRLAFEDRLRWGGDPRFVAVPLSWLLSKSHAAERSALIRTTVTEPSAPSGSVAEPEDTTACCAVDTQGNAVVLIHSLASNWGSAFVVEGTGILLNNRAGRGFSLDGDDPNCLAPGKRPMNTLHCCLLARDGRPVMLWGTPGGDLGLQWNVQTLVHVLHAGMDPQSAIELPRWHSFPGSDRSQLHQPVELQLEEGFAEETLAGLARRGHRLRSLERWSAQSAIQLVAIDHERRLLVGASDPRAEGLALGV